MREFSLALTNCLVPIITFTQLTEEDRECFADDDTLWKRVKEDKEFSEREVKWFSVKSDFVRVCLKQKEKKDGSN